MRLWSLYDVTIKTSDKSQNQKKLEDRLEKHTALNEQTPDRLVIEYKQLTLHQMKKKHQNVYKQQ